MADSNDGFTLWQRHATSIVFALVASSITFAASFFFNSNKDQALLGAKLDDVLSEITDLKSEVREARDVYFTRAEGKDHEDRIRHLEHSRRIGR